MYENASIKKQHIPLGIERSMKTILRCVILIAITLASIKFSFQLFLVPASAPQLVKQRLWYVLSCLWDDAYKRTLAANLKE